ncbi:hypothetical protein [Aquiflexum sp.]|uniref:hypothetical protein n=1 Tax=Aquiflexum sp. TaxID=1872584 RepID=UPI00359373D4
MMNKKSLKKKWLIYSVAGILLMGLGFSVLGESIISKYSNGTFIHWFLTGTVGLILVFAGLSIFGQAVVFKSFIDSDKNPFNRI